MTERRYAILIGSSKFTDSHLDELRCPENDVEGLSKILSQKIYGGFEIIPSINDPSGKVLKIIDRTISKTEKNDLVLIYYSGHGKPNFNNALHLATIDTEVDYLDTTSIPIASIKNLVDKSNTDRIIIILDCCYAGRVGEAFMRGSVDDQLHFLSSGRGTYILAASTGLQMAREKESDVNGLFTKHLIAGLDNGTATNDEGNLTMDSLYAYIWQQMAKEPGGQEPQKWDLKVRGGDLVLAHFEKAREVIENLPEPNTLGIYQIKKFDLDYILENPSDLSLQKTLETRSGTWIDGKKKLNMDSRIYAAVPNYVMCYEEINQAIYDLLNNSQRDDFKSIVGIMKGIFPKKRFARDNRERDAEEYLANSIAGYISKEMEIGLIQLTIQELGRETQIKSMINKVLPTFYISIDFAFKSKMIDLGISPYWFKVTTDIIIENLSMECENEKISKFRTGTMKAFANLEYCGHEIENTSPSILFKNKMIMEIELPEMVQFL